MSTRAKVRVSFEMVFESGSWGDECSLGQVRTQARRSAETAARRVCEAAVEHTKVGLCVTSYGEPVLFLPGSDG